MPKPSTIALDEKIKLLIEDYASQCGISFDDAINELVREGVRINKATLVQRLQDKKHKVITH